MALEVSANPQAFNCETCETRFCDDSNPAPFDHWVITSQIKFKGLPMRMAFKTCPKNQVNPSSQETIDLFAYYKDGHLPDSGGILDQPAALMDAFHALQVHFRGKTHGKQQRRSKNHSGR